MSEQPQRQRVDPSQIKKIDPKKFVGGENLEKLKGLLKDVDGFTSKVKEKATEVEETFDRLRTFTDKFGQTVDHMHKVVEANRILFEKMLQNMDESWKQTLEDRNGRDAR